MATSSPLGTPAQRHLDKARENFALYQQLRSLGRLDWAVVLLFYAALQLVDAWFIEHHGQKPEEHSLRNQWVARHLGSIRRQYGDLFSASRDARYDLHEYQMVDVDRLEQGPFGHVRAQMANRGVAL